MDVQILYMISRCSKSQAFYFQAMSEKFLTQKYSDRFGSPHIFHMKGRKWACWNGKNFNLWIFSGGLSSLRLMWNIEKPRTHSRTRKCSLLTDWLQTFSGENVNFGMSWLNFKNNALWWIFERSFWWFIPYVVKL